MGYCSADQKGKMTSTHAGVSGNTAGIDLQGNAVVNLYSGSLSDSTQSSFRSGGVLVQQNAAFHLFGGAIKNNIGSSAANVQVDGGTFKQYGGEISGSTGRFQGGVYVTEGAFHMYGGAIKNHTTSANNAAGGVMVGTSANTSCFYLHDGEISGNSGTQGGGVAVQNYGTFVMEDGRITNNHSVNSGGGIFNTGTVTLSGGSITGNRTDKETGGGICNTYSGGEAEMMKLSGNPNITGNTNKDGNPSNLYLLWTTATLTGQRCVSAPKNRRLHQRLDNAYGGQKPDGLFQQRFGGSYD